MSRQPTRPTDDIRRRLLAGEPLTTAGTADDYGCSRALLGSVVVSLRGEGVQIATEKQSNGTAIYTAQDVTIQPDQHGPARGVRKMAGRGAGTAKAKPSRAVAWRDDVDKAKQVTAPAKRRNGVAIPTLPPLNAELRVCLLAVDQDGRISIGIRGDAGTWLTSVDGFSASNDRPPA